MLYIYTNPTLTERLSARFSGTVDAVVQNTLNINYDATQAKVAVGEKLNILEEEPYSVTVTNILVDRDNRVTITVTPEPKPGLSLGTRVQSSELLDPDLITGPGTNFPVSIRPLYIASDTLAKRYREIVLGLTAEPPDGVEVEFSLDRVTWAKEVSLFGLPSKLEPYRLVYRRVIVNRQDPVDLSSVSYKLDAEEFLNYTSN